MTYVCTGCVAVPENMPAGMHDKDVFEINQHSPKVLAQGEGDHVVAFSKTCIINEVLSDL